LLVVTSCYGLKMPDSQTLAVVVADNGLQRYFMSWLYTFGMSGLYPSALATDIA